ncbi:LacI family DNA-binding transcriptional regulator [Streptomyces sp. CA-111067]|uniref:LacI family DNA-binding transcriptional regulator n=1 Tax=Streptomyces sp. CA-111067 TaxID=3240046 RepID=UPI003D997865
MDIAREAGVAKVTASYALNGRSGVAKETRERVLAAAERLGWQANSAARALSASRSGSVGLVLARSAGTLAFEPFYMQLISGIEATLSAGRHELVLQLADTVDAALETYRGWWTRQRVDGVLVTDLRVDDPRVDWLRESGMPAVVIGALEGGELPYVWSDDADVMRSVVQYLGAMGHRRIARVSGPKEFVHTAVRDEAFADAARLFDGMTTTVIATDYTDAEGARATRTLLTSTAPPTAIVYDNDVTAVAGVGVAEEMGVEVPAELSVVAWDDSVLCRLNRPALTSVSRDIVRYGTHAAQQLLRVLDGEPAGELRDVTPYLVPRGSTAPARKARPRRG